MPTGSRMGKIMSCMAAMANIRAVLDVGETTAPAMHKSSVNSYFDATSFLILAQFRFIQPCAQVTWGWPWLRPQSTSLFWGLAENLGS